ncbi:GNAT family N-acetyltransferase [Clostridiaceae bacterium M8S5]|nr:GNAT family N-acetyltransferase [Clostridiaceae bacterium M8S5]
MNVIVKELKIDEIHQELLKNFNRYQEVKKVWRVENGKKIIKDTDFTEYWDNDKKQAIIEELKQTLRDGGAVFCVVIEDKVVGFASLGGTGIGQNKEYLQLIELQVSSDLRRKGIGKLLFKNCVDKARILRANKLYISGHSSVETQSFYKQMGCVEAKWLSKKQVELEPYDCQLEYVL